MPVPTRKRDESAAPIVSFVSLGCPKALVDSERIITRLRAEGYALGRDHKGADLVILCTPVGAYEAVMKSIVHALEARIG